MVQYKDYIAAWLDSSVHEFLKTLPHSFPSINVALITCLDSEAPTALLSKSPELARLAPVAKRLGKGLLVPTSALLDAVLESTVFFGFDEVFFFQDEITTPRPGGLSLVGPEKIDQKTMDGLGEWMISTSCTLALGDGDGLNFIMKVRGLVRYVVGHVVDLPPDNSKFVEAPTIEPKHD